MPQIRVWAIFSDAPGVSLGTRRQLIGTYNDRADADLAMMEFEAISPGASFELEQIEDEPSARL